MASQLAILYRLQEIDTRIGQVQEALDQLDDGTELQARVASLRQEHEQAERRQRELEKEILDQELEMKSLEAKKKDFRDRLYSGRVSNPKELSDIEKEVEMLSKAIDQHEDTILQLMDDVESQRRSVADIQSTLSEAEGQLSIQLQRYGETGDRFHQDLADLEQKRQTVHEDIAPNLLGRYEEIRVRSDNLAVVKLSEQVCAGCHVSLPIDTFRQLKNSEQPQFCENCGRILYWEKVIKSEES